MCDMASWSENFTTLNKYPALSSLCLTEETVIMNFSFTSFDSVDFCFL